MNRPDEMHGDRQAHLLHILWQLHRTLANVLRLIVTPTPPPRTATHRLPSWLQQKQQIAVDALIRHLPKICQTV